MNQNNPFVKATRKRVFLKVAFTGPSGSGKTMSALMMAQGLAGKAGRIAVLDTENGSASLYSDKIDFDAVDLGAPFTVQRYIEIIRAAQTNGYDVLVIDSLSHSWVGEGGLLAQKEALDGRGGNSFTNWATITKQQEALKAALLQADMHIIATMRSKTEYAVETVNGKAAPKKIGTKAEQREGMEYEFSVVLDVGMGHEAIVSKDRTGVFASQGDVVGIITPRHGHMLRDWLSSAAEPIPVNPAVEAPVNPPVESPAPAAPQAAKPIDLFSEARKAFIMAALDNGRLPEGLKGDERKAKIMSLLADVCRDQFIEQDADSLQCWQLAAEAMAKYKPTAAETNAIAGGL